MAAPKPMSWGVIIGALALTAVVTGLLLGTLSELTGFAPTAGVGAATGVVGALLVANRARAVAAQKNEKS